MGHLLASRPNEIVAMDLSVLESTTSGIENALVMMDKFRKYTMAVATSDRRVATVAQVLVTVFKIWCFSLDTFRSRLEFRECPHSRIL